jgi:tetratricopeptide (TPR) repeat protein
MTPRQHAAIALGLLAMTCGGCGWFDRPPRVDEKQAIERYVRAQLRLESGDVQGALADLDAAIKANPNLSIAHETAGDIHRRQGDHEAARVYYEKACAINRYSFRTHYNLGITYQALASQVRSPDSKTAMERYFDYLRQAADVYVRAIIIKPDDFDANINLSACYFQLGKYDQALQYCQAAIAIDPQSACAYSNLGVIYDSQNRLYDAINAYKESLERDTRQPGLWLNLGATQLRQRQPKAALYSFEQAAALSPQDSLALEQQGLCYWQMQDYTRALDAYDRAAKINPKSAGAFRGIGVVHMGQYLLTRDDELRDRALAAWNRSLELKSDQEDLRRLVEKYTPRPSTPQL